MGVRFRNTEAERELNEKIRRCFQSSAQKVGLYVAGVFFDGIAKEGDLIFL